MIIPDTEEILHRLLFGGLSEEDFVSRYEDEVGELKHEVKEDLFSVDLPSYGKSQVEVFRGGLAILTDSEGLKYLFETLPRVEEREHISRWAEFSRGHWSNEVPAKAGIYPCRSRDGRLVYRELRLVRGRLTDISGSIVPFGSVTTWQGQWWSLPLQSFPGAL